MRPPLASALPLLLAACVSVGGPGGATPESLAAGLVGRWDNRVQVEAAPAGALPGPPWIDRQHVTISARGPGAVEIAWRTGGPEAPVWRTDRLTFVREGAGMRLRGVREEDGRRLALEGACAFAVTPTGPGHFDARIDPFACRIPGPDGGEIGYQARLTLTTTALFHEEAGLVGEDAFAFRRPDGPPYELRPAP